MTILDRITTAVAEKEAKYGNWLNSKTSDEMGMRWRQYREAEDEYFKVVNELADILDSHGII